MAAAFPSIFKQRKATFKGMMILPPGTKNIPASNGKLFSTLVAQGLATKKEGGVSVSSFTLLGSSPAEYQDQLWAVLPVLRTLHQRANSAAVIYDFVRKGSGGNTIDEENVGVYTSHAYPPTLGELIRACNRPNVSHHYVHIRLREPLDPTLLPAPEPTNPATLITTTTTTSSTTNMDPTQESAADPNSSMDPAVDAVTGPAADPVIDPATDPALAAQPGTVITPVIAALPIGEDYEIDWDPFDGDAPYSSPVHVDLTSATDSDSGGGGDVFHLEKYLMECFPQCSAAFKHTIFARMEGPFYEDLVREVRRMNTTELHSPLRVKLHSNGGGTSLASDVGGVSTHYFYRAFQEVLNATKGSMNPRRAFSCTDHGLWMPSDFNDTLTDLSFWQDFGIVLYFAFTKGMWMGALHPAVNKFLLGYRVGATDLQGYSAAMDSLLAEDADVAAIDSALLMLNIDTSNIAVPDGSTPRLHKQHLLANGMLHTKLLPALMSMKQGFEKFAHRALFIGGVRFGPLTPEYFKKFVTVARTSSDIVNNTSNETDRANPAYNVWEAALRELETSQEIGALMAWICGTSTLPPQEPLVINFNLDPSQQGNMPVAHVCHNTVELSATKYLAPLSPTPANGVARLVSDLRFVLHHANEMSLA